MNFGPLSETLSAGVPSSRISSESFGLGTEAAESSYWTFTFVALTRFRVHCVFSFLVLVTASGVPSTALGCMGNSDDLPCRRPEAG